MMLKPLFRLSQKMKLRYVKYFKLCLGLSIVAIAGTIVLLSTIGLNFGIDFKGGTLIQIETPPQPTPGISGPRSHNWGLAKYRSKPSARIRSS